MNKLPVCVVARVGASVHIVGSRRSPCNVRCALIVLKPGPPLGSPVRSPRDVVALVQCHPSVRRKGNG